MQHNPLLEPVSCLLENRAEPISEYALLQQLREQGWLADMGSDTLALYSAHFLLYNALYQLNRTYLPHNKHIVISALVIQLFDSTTDIVGSDTGLQAQAGHDQATDTQLQEYYLDWTNLTQANQASVEQLLDSFWQQYVADDDYQQALSVLELGAGSSYSEVKHRYRQLAMQYHPDRGGNAREFQRLSQAFALLQRRMS